MFAFAAYPSVQPFRPNIRTIRFRVPGFTPRMFGTHGRTAVGGTGRLTFAQLCTNSDRYAGCRVHPQGSEDWPATGRCGAFFASRGKGSHGTLHLGSAFTTVKDRKKEIGPGLLRVMLKDLGLDVGDFE
jgi:predicted RNA binding protein YcfA (HicA-like mRNA interferase family)